MTDKVASTPPLYWTFFAGSLAKLSELPFGHPLERIKIHMHAHPHLSTKKAITEIHAMGGAREFYKAVRWPMLATTYRGGVHWTINSISDSTIKKIYPKHFAERYPSLISASIGVQATLMSTLYICPQSNLKVREATRDWSGKVRMWQLLKKEGIGMLYRGWDKVIVKHGLTWITYLVAYEKYKQYAKKTFSKDPVKKRLFVGVATGSTAALIHTPFDLALTRSQKENPHRGSIIAAIREVGKEHGFWSVYRSLPIKLARSSVYSAITLLAMDFFNALPSHMTFK